MLLWVIYLQKKLVKKPEVWYYDIHALVVKYYYYFYIGQHYVNFIVYSLSQKSMYYVHVIVKLLAKKRPGLCNIGHFYNRRYIYKYIYIFSYITLAYKKVSEIHHQTLHDFPKQKGIF